MLVIKVKTVVRTTWKRLNHIELSYLENHRDGTGAAEDLPGTAPQHRGVSLLQLDFFKKHFCVPDFVMFTQKQPW